MVCSKIYWSFRWYEALQTEQGVALVHYTEGFCRDSAAIVKNGNVYYLGFFCKNEAEVYYDIIAQHLDLPEPIHKDLEEADLGTYKMYLNHGDTAIPLSGYDLLSEQHFDAIEPYGVVMVEHRH